MLDNIVVVLIVVSIVVQLPLFLPMLAAVLVLRLLRSSLLLGIVDFVYVLVGLDEVDAELPERGGGGVPVAGLGPGRHGAPRHAGHGDEVAARVSAAAARVVEAHDGGRQHVRLVAHPAHADHCAWLHRHREQRAVIVT